MRQAILGVILGSVITTGAALIIRVENGGTPVWSISQAEQKQRELNAERLPSECGIWMVNRHPDGEGRLRYDVGGCPPTYPLRLVPRFLEQTNELLDSAQSVREIYSEVERVQTTMVAFQHHYDLERETKGTDAEVSKMFKTLER